MVKSDLPPLHEVCDLALFESRKKQEGFEVSDFMIQFY